MNCKEIIIKYLKDNGYDGLLCTEVPCGCPLDDLAPCEENMFDCIPAYKIIGKCSECKNPCEAYDSDVKEQICFTRKKPDTNERG